MREEWETNEAEQDLDAQDDHNVRLHEAARFSLQAQRLLHHHTFLEFHKASLFGLIGFLEALQSILQALILSFSDTLDAKFGWRAALVIPDI